MQTVRVSVLDWASENLGDILVALGIAAANGGTPLAESSSTSAPRDPAAPTGYPMLDALPADWKLHVLQLARAQAHQNMAVARESLRGKVQDATAEYMATGMASKPPSAISTQPPQIQSTKGL